jgi:hypothetical protein
MKYEREPLDVLCAMSHLVRYLKDGIDVAVFRDNGWGDDPDSGGSSYTIIVNGNGQVPFGSMSKECFDLLRKDGYLEHNTLRTYKDRGYHKYLGPDNIYSSTAWKYVPMNIKDQP